jgi:hypothetical protein
MGCATVTKAPECIPQDGTGQIGGSSELHDARLEELDLEAVLEFARHPADIVSGMEASEWQ